MGRDIGVSEYAKLVLFIDQYLIQSEILRLTNLLQDTTRQTEGYQVT
jgi:hypothetical protein